MKQIIEKYYYYFSRHKICRFKPADCDSAHYRCNPRARSEKCCAANLVNFHLKNAPKVNLTTWTNIITLSMNTVKHFVKISVQKFEIMQRKVVKHISCCLPHCHFVFNFGFVGTMTLHLKSQFWMDWTHMVYFWQIGYSQSFLLICWGVAFMPFIATIKRENLTLNEMF